MTKEEIKELLLDVNHDIISISDAVEIIHAKIAELKAENGNYFNEIIGLRILKVNAKNTIERLEQSQPDKGMSAEEIIKKFYKVNDFDELVLKYKYKIRDVIEYTADQFRNQAKDDAVNAILNKPICKICKEPLNEANGDIIEIGICTGCNTNNA